MNSKWNFRLASVALAGLALGGMGCSGFGASGSVSPASLFLPGIGHHDSQKNPPAQASVAVDQPASPQVAAYSAHLVP